MWRMSNGLIIVGVLIVDFVRYLLIFIAVLRESLWNCLIGVMGVDD